MKAPHARGAGTKTLFSSTVLARVRELIVTGAFPAGAHLAAEPVAELLGVSRTPVRAAFSVLMAEGLLEHSLNRGYSVRELSVRDILGAIDLRAAIEGRGCALSVEYGWSEQELDTLDGRIADGGRIVAERVWSEAIEHAWYEINRDIHALIGQMAHNVAIRSTIRMTLLYPIFGDAARLCPAIARYVPERHRQLPASVPDHIVRSQEEHRAIAGAIRAGDAAAAERLMRDHVLAGRDRLSLLASRR